MTNHCMGIHVDLIIELLLTLLTFIVLSVLCFFGTIFVSCCLDEIVELTGGVSVGDSGSLLQYTLCRGRGSVGLS